MDAKLVLVIISATIAVAAAYPQPPPPPSQDNSAVAASPRAPMNVHPNSARMNSAVQPGNSAKANQYYVLYCSNAIWAGYDYIYLCILDDGELCYYEGYYLDDIVYLDILPLNDWDYYYQIPYCPYYEKKSRVSVEEEDKKQCVCKKDDNGQQVCTPANCNDKRLVRVEEEDKKQCVCKKDDNGQQVCTPENCNNAQTQRNPFIAELAKLKNVY